jgi:lipoprotein NlpI
MQRQIAMRDDVKRGTGVFASGIAVLATSLLFSSLWFALPAHAQVDPRKCSAPVMTADERLAACTAAIEAAAGDWRSLAAAYAVRARVYLARKDFDHAIADYSQIIKYDPQNRYVYAHRGRAYAYNEDFDRAIADFGEEIRIEPTNEAVYVDRAVAYHRSGRISSAMSDYDHAIGLNPKSPLVYQSRGAVYLHEEDFDRAIDDFSQAIRLNPVFEPAYFLRARTYIAKGESDRALADLERMIQLYPKHGLGHAIRAEAFEAKGDLDRAIAERGEVIRLDPKNVFAHRGRARAYIAAGSFADALADLDQAKKLDLKNPYTALWREIAAKRGQLPSELAETAAQLDMTKWPAPIVRLFLGEMSAEAVLATADDDKPGRRKEQTCEANFFIGELALQHGEKDKAARLFKLAVADCPKGFVEYSSANAELKALEAKP